MLTYTDHDHKYYWNGVKTLGVNEILQASGVSNFDHIPAHLREGAMHFGKVVHATCELWDRVNLDIEQLMKDDKDSEYKVLPYLEGWIKFKKESGCKIISIENKFYSKRGFAGRHDRVVLMPDLTMLDIKMSVDAKGGTDLQLAAYSILWDENQPPSDKIKNRIAVRLTPENYQIIPFKNKSDRNDFLICLNQAKLLQKRGILK